MRSAPDLLIYQLTWSVGEPLRSSRGSSHNPYGSGHASPSPTWVIEGTSVGQVASPMEGIIPRTGDAGAIPSWMARIARTRDLELPAIPSLSPTWATWVLTVSTPRLSRSAISRLVSPDRKSTRL